MALPRDLVELEQALRARGVDLFVPVERSGLLDEPDVRSLTMSMQSFDFDDPTSVLRLCLQALRVQHDEMAALLVEAELVATLPPDMPGLVRTTAQVVREMIRQAEKEVILLGYELTDLDMVRLLAEASGRGAEVILISDRERGASGRVLRAWPIGSRLPRVFEDKERSDGALYASMHAKCLLVDSRDLLITSANFTFHGLHGNIEIGVRLAGPPALEARKIFSHLVETRVIEELR